MASKMPVCPYRADMCPGSSDEAWLFFDEDAGVLDDWMCPTCRIEFRIANDIPLDDDYEPSVAGDARIGYEKVQHPAV